MFNSFRRKLPEITVFHKSSSPSSNQAVHLLRSALSEPYPPGHEDGKGQPLAFQLEVIESPPNPDQLKTIMSYLPSRATNPNMLFLSAHYSAPSGSDQPTTIQGISELAQKNPNALKWPIVVDWLDGQASVGDVEGVKKILERLRQKRDGEIEDES